MLSLKKLTFTMVLLMAAAQTAQAAIGMSTNYSLEIADLTNSGATATSANYILETAITGDTADGKSYSKSYVAGAGLIEEAYSDYIDQPAPTLPPPPGGGGYPHDIRPYRPPVTTQETQETQITQETQETEELQPTQEVPAETQETQEPLPEWVTPSAPPEAPTGEISPGEIPPGQIWPGGTMYPEFGQELWCQNGSCFGSPTVTALRPAAIEGGINGFSMIWWPWIFILIFSFFSCIPFSLPEPLSK